MVDSPVALHVYLARHGRTPLNADGRLGGLADSPLDEVGVAEAHRLARVLLEVRPSRVLSSPLGRAVQTAEIIADTAGVSTVTDGGFADTDYGPWTGHVVADVVDEWGSVDAAPGVEAPGMVLARATAALDSAVDGGPFPHPLVIVTHDAVIRALIASIDRNLRTAVLPTGSWTHLARTGGRWTVLQVGQLTASDLSPTPPPSARPRVR